MELAELLGGSDALVALDAAYSAAWTATDPVLLASCRNRIAMLLGHTPTLDAMTADDKEALSGWTSSHDMSECERAALEFTEQYIIDVASMTDRQATALGEHLGDSGLVSFVNALLVVEQRMTLELALEGVLG